MSKLETFPATIIERGKVKIRCEHCGQYETAAATRRYHSDRCKMNPARTARRNKADKGIGQHRAVAKGKVPAAAHNVLQRQISEHRAAGNTVIQFTMPDGEIKHFALIPR